MLCMRERERERRETAKQVEVWRACSGGIQKQKCTQVLTLMASRTTLCPTNHTFFFASSNSIYFYHHFFFFFFLISIIIYIGFLLATLTLRVFFLKKKKIDVRDLNFMSRSVYLMSR